MNVLDWQPIETAPKDRRILLRWEKKGFSGDISFYLSFGQWNGQLCNIRPNPYWEPDYCAWKDGARQNPPKWWTEVE